LVNDSRPTADSIADQLRLAIAAGELRPGDRVPSTRDIVRDHGVAMATASKALTRLRTDRLVRVVPGVGTVVADPRPRPRREVRDRPTVRDGDGLSTLRIVTTAIAIADAEGLEAASMRRVATALGVAPMSLYRHVADKEALLVAMLEVALAEWRPVPSGDDGWRRTVESASVGLWTIFNRHPWLAGAMSATRPQPLRGGLVYSEQILAALATIEPDPATAFTLHLVLFNYTRGLALNLEPEREAEAETGLTADAWMDTRTDDLRRVLHTAPIFGGLLEQLMATGYDFDLDEVFRIGLRLLLDGLEASARR
jgi:DNA-binding transcriptional regulator YhcF (GntR family)